MYMWNTEEGGPCFLRPTPVSAFDNPGKKQVVASGCMLGVNSDGTCNIKSFCEKKRGAYCDENNILHGGVLAGVKSEAVGPVTDDMSEDELESRWVQGFDNQFAFPWEIGMYWKFHVGGRTYIHIISFINSSTAYIINNLNQVLVKEQWVAQDWMKTLEQCLIQSGHLW